MKNLKTDLIKYTLLISIGWFWCLQILSSQSDVSFHPPVDHPIILAGSFGEIRSTHFHAGLDIKPSDNTDGDSIRCSELGYVSRIKIQRSGYGRAVYIDHPNGYTSVYAHLKSFNSQLEKAILALQRNAQSYEIDIYPSPGEFIIEKGGFIGKMGNSGRSYGKHLHYEIRATASEHPINPMLFGIGPEDDVPPIITGIAIHGLTKDGQTTTKKRYGSKLPTSLEIPAWRVGIAVAGYDQMSGAQNKNGIFEMALFVDDTLYYHQKLDEVSFDEMNQIKAHIDYEDKINIKSTYARLYTLPGNRLSIIDSIKNNGIIPIYKNRSRSIKIKVRDLNGNIAMSSTTIRRKDGPKSDSQVAIPFNLLAEFDQSYTFEVNPLQVNIPAFSLSRTEKISFSTEQVNGSTKYRIGKESIALLGNINVSLSIKELNISDLSKTSLMKYENCRFVDYGSRITNDSLHTSIGSFGDYFIVTDTLAPNIQPVSFPKKNGGTALFSIQDNIVTKGKAKMLNYDVYINGEWKPCEYKEITKTLYVPVKSLSDEILIITSDQYSNTARWSSK